MDPATRRRAIRMSTGIAIAAIAGLALVIASDATAADVAGIVLAGGAAVAAVAWVFLEIGLSEDAERERAEREPPP